MTIESPLALNLLDRALTAFIVSERIKLEQSREPAPWHRKVKEEIAIAKDLQDRARKEFHKQVSPFIQNQKDH